MEVLTIEGTKSTPEIRFDPVANTLSIRGQSYPENAFKFYEPIIGWMENYLSQLSKHSVQIVFELQLPYINTSSTKCFMFLLDKLEEAYKAGKDVQIHWYVDADNESELECAEEFKEDLTLPFEIIHRNVLHL